MHSVLRALILVPWCLVFVRFGVASGGTSAGRCNHRTSALHPPVCGVKDIEHPSDGVVSLHREARSMGRRVVTLEVGPTQELRDAGACMRMVMLVREEGKQDFEYFYDHINGFDYVAGYTYKLRVEERDVTPVAHGGCGSSVEYTLLETLSKHKADPEDTTEELIPIG